MSAQHVTIAPIAPTLLKTGGAWAEGFGDEGASDDGFAGLGLGGLYNAAYGLGGGSASYTAAMDGAWAWNEGRARPSRGGSGEVRSVGRGEEEASEGTPVELVYAPPLGSGYARSAPRTYSASPGAFHSDYGGGGGEGYFTAEAPGYDGGMSDGAGFGYAPGGYGNGVYAGFGRTTVGGTPRPPRPEGAEEERVEDAGMGAGVGVRAGVCM